MRPTSILLSLPAPLLLLIATFQPSGGSAVESSSAQWPYNLPAHVKYWPEDPPYRRRDLEVIERHFVAGKTPIGLKKMGMDEGEKFFPEYWNFGENYQSSHFDDEYSSLDGPQRLRVDDPGDSSYMNDSMSTSFRHPFALHKNEDSDLRRNIYGRAYAALFNRNVQTFTCPTGTLSCSNINQPNSCCGSDETCFIIQDTGLGDVGCCPTGETCTGQAISCPADYESCPDNTGGGCCIPGFVCDGPGCVPSQSVVTVITTITVLPPTGTSVVVYTTTTIQPEPQPSFTESASFTASASFTESASFTASASFTESASVTFTATGIQTTLMCSSNYRACPIQQGGGCCLTDRECGTTDCPTYPGSGPSSTLMFTTASGTAVIPLRPTSSNPVTTFQSTGVTILPTGSTCPIGFYGCSAIHQGGCCRTGRNCDTTSCPAVQETTIISASVTIAFPNQNTVNVATTGSCANGWFNCADVLDGGCCPNGYSCGTASCSSFSGSETVQVGPKETAVIYVNGVGRSRMIGLKGWLGGALGVCWIGGVVMVLILIW